MGNHDTDNLLWGLLGFFIPPAGLILFLVWRQERPNDGHHALMGALWGAGIFFIARILFGLFWMTIFAPFFEAFFSMGF
jgi:uncharacterized membrane protein